MTLDVRQTEFEGLTVQHVSHPVEVPALIALLIHVARMESIEAQQACSRSQAPDVHAHVLETERRMSPLALRAIINNRPSNVSP